MSDEWAQRFEGGKLEADDSSNTGVEQEANSSDIDFGQKLYSFLLDGKLHRAPISSPKKILNVGCGKGTWAIDTAKEYANTKVLAVEKTNVDHLTALSTQDNLRFETKDIEAKNAFEKDSFDFIYSRDVFSHITDWDAYLANLHSYLTPGGYVEVVEWDITVGCDDNTFSEALASYDFYNKIVGGLKGLGKDIDAASKIKGNLEKAGFKNVTEHVAKIPMSAWPKDPKYKQLGAYTFNSLPNLQKYAELVIGLSPEKAKELVQGVIAEFKSGKVHIYSKIRILVGQKA